MACIYKITNTADNNKVYIGQTMKTAEWRLKEHHRNRNNKNNPTQIILAMRQHKIDVFKVEAIVEGDFNKKLLYELEKHYIQLHASTFPDKGYNRSKGGVGGFQDFIHNKDWQKSRKKHIYTAEEKAIRSQKMKGKRPYDNRKPILQYNLSNDFIKEWDSTAAASEALSFTDAGIYQVLSGRRKQIFGFIFKYKQ